MSLRTVVTLAMGVTTLLAVVISLALFLITTQQRQNAATIHGAVWNVHLAESLEIGLLSHDRARDGVVRANLEGRMRRDLDRTRRFVGSAEEAKLIADADAALQRYFADPTPETLRFAFGRLEALVRVNLVQTEEATRSIVFADQIANASAVALCLMVVSVTIALSLWLRRASVEPVQRIASALQEFAGGKQSSRAPEIGPREFRDIARHVNALADTVVRQRTQQLTFLAGVSHDLRTPVATLRLSLSTLERQPPERALRLVRVAQQQLDRLERMLGDLTDATRIEAGELELRMEAVDLRMVAREAMELFSGATDRHHVCLQLPESPVTVNGDFIRLGQVATNLVSNAVKYSPDGGQVVVSVAVEGEQAVLSVADEGVGIPPTELARVFEPFHRVGQLGDRVPGVGLGLSVARRIVQDHAGSIDVDSEPGRGTTFRVRLPLLRERRAARHPEA